MISVVLRTKNEGEWARRSLVAVSNQAWRTVQIIVVDNQSDEATRQIISEFECTVASISDAEFTHGRSLNVGIGKADAELVAITSGHCIPVNDRWLQHLAAHFDDPRVAGVYGRQEPLPDTDDFDKRDLWTTFGIERRLQLKDFMFHNANSMIRKSVWAEIPFDEEIGGVEDRDWAKKVLARGYRIIYEPEASVYHHHGIHHGRDAGRAARVAKVIEMIAQGGEE